MITWTGPTDALPDRMATDFDASGRIVVPGFVDSHTHAVFAETRAEEFEWRIEGTPYMEILERGGGILSSVNAVERTTDLRVRFADEFLAHGTTTIEAKSGYGLRLEEETFDLFFYEAGVSMDLLPGRRVTPFVTAGVGASMLDARVEPTYAFGIGTKAFLNRRLALRWELRDHRLKGGNRFTRFSGDNLEFSGGIETLF